MWNCPNCGYDLKDSAKFCPQCGSDEQTGWSEDAGPDSEIELPEDFDYLEALEKELGDSSGTKSRLSRGQKMKAVGTILLALALSVILLGVL